MHRCSTTVQTLPTCGATAPVPPAGQPSRAKDCATPASSSLHRGRLLHHRPRLIALRRSPPPDAPLASIWPPAHGRAFRAKPASVAPSSASHAVPTSSTGRASRANPASRHRLRQADLRPSYNRCRAGQMRPSSLPPASRPRPPCLLQPQPWSRLHLPPLAIVSPPLPAAPPSIDVTGHPLTPPAIYRPAATGRRSAVSSTPLSHALRTAAATVARSGRRIHLRLCRIRHADAKPSPLPTLPSSPSPPPPPSPPPSSPFWPSSPTPPLPLPLPSPALRCRCPHRQPPPR
ncbi:vegetative cell wall protein gp1-like [Oryza sativa Japonica Group]|uniref:vegetative cell wall protein gp1-like n=1 Tax=Oryza sativa subsp. japonica TaxID=39947 RepID=UPI00339C6920